MNILVIDGMGGGMGKAVVEQLKVNPQGDTIIAVGANALATAAMLKAGAHHGATGENAVVYNSAHADVIIGVMGILFANAMYGEITPLMAAAVSASPAHKILIPMDKCGATVLGTADRPIQAHLQELNLRLDAIRRSMANG